MREVPIAVARVRRTTAMPFASSLTSPPLTDHSRFSAARVATNASVFCPPGRAMTSSESAEIATLVLRAMAASRSPCTSARLSRERW